MREEFYDLIYTIKEPLGCWLEKGPLEFKRGVGEGTGIEAGRPIKKLPRSSLDKRYDGGLAKVGSEGGGPKWLDSGYLPISGI